VPSIDEDEPLSSIDVVDEITVPLKDVVNEIPEPLKNLEEHILPSNDRKIPLFIIISGITVFLGVVTYCYSDTIMDSLHTINH